MDSVDREVTTDSTLETETWFYPALFAFGILVSIAESLYMLILGNTLENAVWPIAIRTLEWTLYLRDNLGFVTMLSGIVLAYSLYFMTKKEQSKPTSKFVTYFSVFLIGFILGNYVVFMIMDARYLRGAFLILPTVYGVLLLSSCLIARGTPKLPQKENKKLENFYSVGHLICVFFAAWLIMPGLPAMMGFAPSPPPKPNFGYGSEPGPFEEVLFTYQYDLPTNVTAIQGGTEDDIDFSIYLSIPNIPPIENIPGIPLAIIFHAFNNPDRSSYTDWIDHLVGRGSAVAFIQYPTDVRPDGGDDFDATTTNGTSDWPHHVPRLYSIQSALNKLAYVIDDATRENDIDELLGNLSIMPEHLYIGGHSLGGAYSLNALEMARQLGWGNESLVVNTEMAASRPVQNLWSPDFSNLTENRIVHLVVAQDDMTVGLCDSVHHHSLFSPGQNNNTIVIYVPSDKYGYPRLVATHYIPANEVHDTLADWAFYKRVDAQIDWLVSRTWSDYNTEEFAYIHLTDNDLLTDMGEWSDGVKVLPMKTYSEPLEAKVFDHC